MFLFASCRTIFPDTDNELDTQVIMTIILVDDGAIMKDYGRVEMLEMLTALFFPRIAIPSLHETRLCGGRIVRFPDAMRL